MQMQLSYVTLHVEQGRGCIWDIMLMRTSM